MRPNIRFWTALALIGVCGYSIARGLVIVHFSLAMANIDSLKRQDEIVNAWRSVPDVASVALRAELTKKIDTSDPKAADTRREALLSILSIEPLSPMDWLSLSAAQLLTDQPMEQVFDSLEMSMITGPNEGYVRADRRIYGVSLWERLSADLKRRVALDVAVGEIPDGEKFRAVVAAQPERVRNELRQALIASGLPPKEIERRLGP
jgi:hypothetical protein